MEIQAALARLGRKRLLVVGDLMLDRYTWGAVDRVSPEAPVLVLRTDDEEVRPGGAASVAALLRGLDAEVVVAGVVGDDADGRRLTHILAECGAQTHLVRIDGTRPTTTKERFLGRNAGRQAHQILRVDREVHAPLAPDLEEELLASIAATLPSCDAVLVSDYAKGTCTSGLIEAVLADCRRTECPVLVDPARAAEYSSYRGATVLKPNRTELQLATRQSIATPAAAIAAARGLCRELDFGAVVATLDRDGMALVPANGAPEIFPTLPQEVCDVTGAGDMALAMLGLSLSSGLSLSDAVRLANVAAGLEVRKVGIAVITRAELEKACIPSHESASRKRVSPQAIQDLAAEHHRHARRIVFTNGCFDLLHAGHVACLEEAASLGDVLIVAVNSDRSVRRLKGPGRPVIGEEDRATMLAALSCVNHVVIFDEETPHRLLEAIRPHVLVKGATTDAVVGSEVVEEAGGVICRTKTRPALSTTTIVERVRRNDGRTASLDGR